MSFPTRISAQVRMAKCDKSVNGTIRILVAMSTVNLGIDEVPFMIHQG